MVNIKELRESKGMTQQQLADACGVIRQTITEYEAGRIRPSIVSAMKLGKALDVEWKNFFEE